MLVINAFLLLLILEVVMTKSTHGKLQQIISEKTLDKLIGVILTNSKDWKKGRSTKNTNNVTENIEETEHAEGEENMCNEENVVFIINE